MTLAEQRIGRIESEVGYDDTYADFNVDSTRLFVLQRVGGQLLRAPRLSAVGQEVFAAVDGTGEALSLSSSYVYASHTIPGEGAAVSRISKTAANGSLPQRLATIPLTVAGDVLYNADYVYFVTLSEFNRVYRARSSTGASLQLLWSGTSAPQDLKISGSNLYFTTDNGQVWRLPKAGGAATMLADRDGIAFEIDSDGSCVSFAVDSSTGGEIVKVSE